MRGFKWPINSTRIVVLDHAPLEFAASIERLPTCVELSVSLLVEGVAHVNTSTRRVYYLALMRVRRLQHVRATPLGYNMYVMYPGRQRLACRSNLA